MSRHLYGSYFTEIDRKHMSVFNCELEMTRSVGISIRYFNVYELPGFVLKVKFFF